MTATRITLPSMDGLTVAALRRLGGGLRYSFQVGAERGVLTLEPWQAPDSEWACSFESGCGVITFSDAGSLLSLFGECPVGLAPNGNDPESWFWALFEHSMSAQLTALFGFLRPLDEVQPGSFECRISVVLGQSRSVSRLSMSPQTLLNLHDTGRWHAIKAPLPSSFPLSVAVVLGHLQLTFEQLRALRRGDVVLLECPHFTAQGVGQLSVGRLQLNVRFDDEDGRSRLNIEAIEEVHVDDVGFTSTEGDADESGRWLEHNEPLEQLPLALSVRCGALTLSLGELRQLAPGVVLTIAGYAPGSAGLYYGDRPIGQGQLVEVDGSLGLQLSRLIFSQ